jgi:hypothetical protein
MFHKKIGKYEVRAFFDKERNKLVNKVAYQRKQLPVEVLNDSLSKSYMGHELVITDLQKIITWSKISIGILSDKNKTEEDVKILHGLFISIVTTYWKCFAETNGRYGVQLNKKIIPKEHLELHNELKEIRNNFTAHCGGDPFEVGYLLLVSDINNKNRFQPFTIPIHRKAANADGQKINAIINLAKSLVSSIENKQKNNLSNILNVATKKTITDPT